MMSWFRKKKLWEEEWSNNIYDSLIGNSGPGGEKFNTKNLEIKVSDLEKYSRKDRLRLEMFCFVALNVALIDKGKQYKKVIFSFGRLLHKKWSEIGIFSENEFDVSEKCFCEFNEFNDAPFKWGSKWLSEFYDSEEKVKDHRILFVDHCIKQYRTMQTTIERFA